MAQASKKKQGMILPQGDRLVVRPVQQETKTAGGLHIPDVAKEKSQQGEVLSVGPGRYSESGALIPMRVEVGQTVLFGKFSGMEITVENEQVLILREADILGIVAE